MKARWKDSNDEWKDASHVKLEGSDILYKEQYLEFQHDTLSTELKTYDQADKEKHWQDLRERTAIAAIQGMLAGDERYISYMEKHEIAKAAVDYADALIEELKKK